jgi:predicted naringenin-chalcone synthase
LEILNADVNKWKTKKEWYDAINEIHDKKAKLENEIFWAQVEGFEKKASEALQRKNHQQSEIDKVCFFFALGIFVWSINTHFVF